ncbi:MAG: translation initiation factor IF-3 [Bdellovibrionota bacterium]
MQIITRSEAKSLSKVRLVGTNMNEIVEISEVFDTAEDRGLDVVLVSSEVTPPVVRIQDFKKLEYEKKKARKIQKKSSGTSSLKEIQLKVNISEHDLETKLNNIRRFLTRGDKVKVMVRLKGRERENPERAHELLDKISAAVESKANKLAGPIAIMILEPLKGSAK